jgi:sulfite reductase (ferredoxin)
VHEQKDGRFYVGARPVAGRISGTLLVQLADLIEEYGVAGARTHAVPEDRVLGVAGRPGRAAGRASTKIGLSARPSNWRRNTMACTGIEFCKLAIVETKDRARDLVAELERASPSSTPPITVNVNGCPNACARTQVADIGLKGQLVMDEGNQVEGFQVHLGGGPGCRPTSAASCAPTR